MQLLTTFCLLIIVVASVDKKCNEDVEYNNYRSPKNKQDPQGRVCEKSPKIDQKDDHVVPFYNRKSVRFNQMQRLHLIGGSVISKDEIEHAYIRLLYLYSCIFPAIQGLNTTLNMDNKERDWIVFQDISDLDSKMQFLGRDFLHRHKKGEEAKLREHLIAFIRDLNSTSATGFPEKNKIYRDFCSKNPSKQKHGEASDVEKKDKEIDEVENMELKGESKDKLE